MDAGELDQRITLLTPTAAKTGTGASTTTFADYIQIWAKYRLPMHGQRALVAGGRRAETDVAVFIVRRRDEIQTDWRVRWRGIEYSILRATPVDRDWTEILAETGLQ